MALIVCDGSGFLNHIVGNIECLTNIVEYCSSANEVECLKCSCKKLYRLLRGEEGELGDSLKLRLSSMYLPRFFLQIVVPADLEENSSTVDGSETNEINDSAISSEIDYYLRDIRRIYGNANIKQVSSIEVEILIDLDDEHKLSQYDSIVQKKNTSPSSQEKIFDKVERSGPLIIPTNIEDHSLCETIRKWRSEHPLEGTIVNPIKVMGKFILHLQFVRNTGHDISDKPKNFHHKAFSQNHIDIVTSSENTFCGWDKCNLYKG